MIVKRNGVDSLKEIQTLKDNSVDFILTDPPYDFGIAAMQWWHYDFLRVSRHGYITWSPPENQWLPTQDTCKKILFWIKPISTKNTSKNYSRFVEMLFVHGEVKWITGRHWSQYTNVFTDIVDDTSIHPYRKPPSAIRRLLLNHTEPGDVVLDCFAGSHVVADVCEQEGRNCISWEKEHYVNLG